MAYLAKSGVALYTSAWIEMTRLRFEYSPIFVALYTSAWIEISAIITKNLSRNRRTLHECVD